MFVPFSADVKVFVFWLRKSEVPPPLPPRRRFIQGAKATEEAPNEARSKRSWNLIDVFGRGRTDPSPKAENSAARKICSALVPFAKSRNIALMPKSQSEHCSVDLLSTKHNSFSTPDLTNIVDAAHPAADDADDVDLDVMDIERSNSLNSSANQFLCRPPTLNISSNILWSYNLSSSMVSTQDQSKINLVGANVNVEQLLGEDISGYCRMAPIIKSHPPDAADCKELAESKAGVETSFHLSRLIDNSGYCRMRPVLEQGAARCPSDEATIASNVTFERKYELDDATFCLADFSLLSSDKHSSNSGVPDETSSSGVSSDEGNAHLSNSFSSLSISPNTLREITSRTSQADDAISLACTNSPGTPDSVRSRHFCSTKIDEKYPSYFPNLTQSSPKPKPSPADAATPKKPLYERQAAKTPTQPRHRRSEPPQHINYKQSNYKTVIKSTPAKVQKSKQRKSSNENIYSERLSQQSTNKKVLAQVDGNARVDYEKNTSTAKAASSPRRIYAKCATLAARLKTPPSTPSDAPPTAFEFKRGDSANKAGNRMSITKSYSLDVVDGAAETRPKRAEPIGSSNGIMRFATISRLRKIDFSPLKTKLNNILQRPNIDY